MGGKPEEWNQDRKFWHKEGQAKTENVWKSQAGNAFIWEGILTVASSPMDLNFVESKISLFMISYLVYSSF